MPIVLGKVIANATADNFSFISKKGFRAHFVSVANKGIYGDATFIGEIIEQQVINPFFEKPSSVRYIDDQDENIAQQSLYLSMVRLIAVIQERRAHEVIYPPLPGLNVYQAEDADIRLALHLEDKGIDIGFVKDYKLQVKVSSSKLLRTHISILGQTGSGKSYLAAKIAQELVKLSKDASVSHRIALPIIIDSSGEYSGEHDLGAQKGIAQIMKTIDIKDQAFPLLNEKYLPLLYEIYDIGVPPV